MASEGPGSEANPWLLCNYAHEASRFKDNVQAQCYCCQTALYHRPHTPPGAVPICFECFTIIMNHEGKPELRVTQESMKELLKEYFGPKTH